MVLFATVHGGLLVDEQKQVKTFIVPEGMKISRIMATRPGICNVTNADQVDELVRDMKELGSQAEDIGKAVENIKASQPSVIENIMGQIKNDDPNRGLFEQFLRSRIATPTLKEFNPGDTMLDKYLARDSYEGFEEAFDFKLLALNMVGKPDLFDTMIFGTSGPATNTRSKKIDREVMTSVLVNLLKARGVEHIIFYDLTCSSFMPLEPISERQERALRKDILQQGWGKKRTRRSNNKTKTRRGKKRTVSKWRR
jgi:hypothetical protein